MSFSDLAEMLGIGTLMGLIPGLHPMLIRVSDPLLLGALYGAFTGTSILVARKGLYHPETAGEGRYSLSDLLKGVGLSLLLLPPAFILYSLELPRWLLFGILVAGSLSLLRSPMAFLLSGILGVIALKGVNAVADPLLSGLLYIFGLSYILGRERRERTGDWKKGALASLITGYFPALPSSAWSRMLGNGSVAVAAVATPLFSLVALLHGKTRAVMTSFIPYADPWILFLVGASFLLSAFLILSLGEIFRIEEVRVPKEVGLGIIAGHAVFNGMGNVLLFAASAGLVYLTRKGDPAAYFGFLVVPTLAYYA